MLDQLRRGAGTVIAKIFIAVLVVSFGIWGIADIFRGFGANQLAMAGDTEITAQQFQRDYERLMRNLGRSTGRIITPADARRLGVPHQVLGRLVTDALLNDAASDLGLDVSNDTLAEKIRDDKTFAGASGKFDRRLFEQILAANGYNEKLFVAEQRQATRRRMLSDALVGGLAPPKPYLQALNRFQNEERTVDWIELGQDAAGPIPDPTPAELDAFFSANRDRFRAPEYRAIDYLALTPEAIADPSAVPEEDVRAAYERSGSFGEPERRHVQQIVFTDRARAEQTLAALQEGKDFDTVLKELGRSTSDVDLGLVERGDIVDPAVAEAAFSLEAGGTTLVDGRFGPVLVRVTKVEPAHKRPFEEVEPELRHQLAVERARDEVLGLYDSIEDAFAGGATVAEVASRFGLEAGSVAAVDRSGHDPEGAKVDLPKAPDLLAQVFETDVGVENAPLQLGNTGYLWYRVTGVTPSHDRKLEDVRPEVVKAWTDEQVTKKLDALSEDVVRRVQTGEPLAEIAAELGVEVKQSGPIKRSPADDKTLPAPAVAAAFEGPQGHVASVEAPGGGRIVLEVTEVKTPAFFAESADVEGLRQELAAALENTLLNDLVNALQREKGVTVNQRLLDQVVGASSES